MYSCPINGKSCIGSKCPYEYRHEILDTNHHLKLELNSLKDENNFLRSLIFPVKG